MFYKKRTIRMEKIIVWTIILVMIVAVISNYVFFGGSLSFFLEKQIESLGYVGVFFFVFLLEFIPQPFLSAIVPYSLGIIVGLKFKYLFPLLLVSALLANFLAYRIGLRYGKEIVGVLVSDKSFKRSLKWFERHGKWSIATLALTPLPYFPVIAGIFRMRRHDFLWYALLPRTIHLVVFGILVMYFL